ncbi:1658_t:CDS:2 [Diversispora eburnea]|uniref:intramembrane prenyl-peptidase Rce1 n=1 Tax=Diversispora eburnea TaxID=1213867 RepID=A0A9N8Z521_9GLOM|nr:1658_t:CDS:2 [Diversispora eburnea]
MTNVKLERYNPLSSNFKINTFIAGLSCLIFTFIYVGLLYISKKTRIGNKNPGLTKNHPMVIKQRMKVTFITCVISCISVWIIINISNGFKNDREEEMNFFTKTKSTFIILGLWIPFNPYYLFNILFTPLLLTMILFIGPLYVKFLDQELPFQENSNFIQEIKYTFTSLIGFRNLIFAPFTEEFVFRSCMISLLYYAKVNCQPIIWISPLVFAIAHIHHAWEYYVNNGRNYNAAKIGIFSSIFQFAYTTIFGWYAAFIFMRTGNFIPTFFVHSFANSQGFPVIYFSEYPKKQQLCK